MSTLNANDKEILNSIFNPLLPMGELQFDENILEDSDGVEHITDDVDSAKALEIAGIKEAGKEEFETALNYFSKAIEAAPNRASGYNNRAQILRLLGKVSEAKTDLNNAINLSRGKGRSASQAYCQRGLLNLRDNLTEDARADFKASAELGSQFAKAQLVQMNPYAALCNKMLRGVFNKLQQGESLNSDEDK